MKASEKLREILQLCYSMFEFYSDPFVVIFFCIDNSCFLFFTVLAWREKFANLVLGERSTSCLTLNLLNFLNGTIHLPFLELLSFLGTSRSELEGGQPTV